MAAGCHSESGGCVQGPVGSRPTVPPIVESASSNVGPDLSSWFGWPECRTPLVVHL